MSTQHPIVSVTGSSGAGTTSVRRTFEHIFRREKITAAFIEGDAFHRYDREQMKRAMAEEAQRGNRHFSHFGPQANLLAELEDAFSQYSRTGTCRAGSSRGTRGSTRSARSDAVHRSIHRAGAARGAVVYFLQ